MARLVVQADIDTYGADIIAEGQTPMQIGDVIFFLSDRNVKGSIFNQTQWTTARNGATVWIEGGLTEYNTIEIGWNGSVGATVPSDADNPNHVHFFGGKGIINRQSDGLSGKNLQFMNFDRLILDFETNSYPGLRDGWGSGRAGTFGLSASSTYTEYSAMNLRIDHIAATMKQLEIRGCELSAGSFAMIRAILQENHLEKFIIERNLITRSAHGEGLYIGQTSVGSSGNWVTLGNFKVRDNIFAFTAAEAIQLQECADGTEVHNNVVFIADTDYRKAFQPFQDTGVQFHLAQGNAKFYDNVIVGFGTNGLQLFSIDLTAQGVTFGTSKPQIYNNVWSRGKAGVAWRIDSSMTAATKIIYRNNDIVSMADNYTDVGNLRNYYFDIASPDSVPIEVIGGNFPDTARPFLRNPAAGLKYTALTRATIDEPEFVKTGFEYIDTDKVTTWAKGYEQGYYHTHSPTSVNPSLLTDGGSVVLTVTHSDREFQTDDKMIIISRADKTKYFYADVNTYSGTTLSLKNISDRSGTSAATDWDVDGRVHYGTDDFVWMTEEDEEHEYLLYKCIVDHYGSHATKPVLDPVTWELVYWDEDGRSMYDPAYNGVPFTTDFMTVAGDFRLVNGSYHHLKGRGLSCNEQREDQTMLGWEWKQTEDGTIRDIPGAYTNTLTFERYSYLKTGVYYRAWVRRMSASGALEDRQYSAWSQI